MLLQAGLSGGIYAVDDFEFDIVLGGKIRSQEEFYRIYKENPDCALMGSDVDAGMEQKIRTEFGIKSFD